MSRLTQWSAAWSVSPVNNPHSHLQQKVGLIEPSSRAKNANMFESWHYDSFPNFTGGSPTSQSIFAMASVVALNGISRHCLAQMHLACSHQCRSKIFQSPTIRNQNYIIQKGKWYSSSFRSENFYTVYGSSCKRKRKSPHRQAGLFPVVGPCACFGAWGHVRHLANHCLTTPTTSPDSAFKLCGLERLSMSSF